MACALAQDLVTLRGSEVGRRLETMRCAREGLYGEVFQDRRDRNDEPVHPQCDASEFLEQLQRVLREGEVAKLAEFGGHREQAVGFLVDCVFNVMMRSRLRCAKCGHVSDRLDMDSCVRLPMPRDGQRTLEELLGDYFLCERMGIDSKCQQCVGVRSARCHGA